MSIHEIVQQVQRVDGTMLSGIGTFLTGVAMAATTLTAFLHRTKILRGWHTFIEALTRPRLVIDERQRREDAEADRDAAENRARNWEATSDAIDRRFQAMEDLHRNEIGELKAQILALQTRNDALVDYSQLMITYSIQLELRAVKSGADLTGLDMPKIPPVLADRLGIPETAR